MRGWKLLRVAVERRARQPALSREADAAVDLIAGELGLVDLARDRIDLVGEEVAVEAVEPLGDRRRDVPAQSEIERQFARQLDIVLHPRRGVDPLEERIRREAGRARSGVSQQHRRRAVAAQRVLRQVIGAREALVETQRCAVRTGAVLRVSRQPVIESGFDGLLAADHHHVGLQAQHRRGLERDVGRRVAERRGARHGNAGQQSCAWSIG